MFPCTKGPFSVPFVEPQPQRGWIIFVFKDPTLEPGPWGTRDSGDCSCPAAGLMRQLEADVGVPSFSLPQACVWAGLVGFWVS